MRALRSRCICASGRKADQARIDKRLEESMALVREVSMAASNARQKGGRKLRWPVSEIVIAPAKEVVDLDGLENVLKGQTNSKKITVLAAGEKPKMDLEMAPVHKKIGPVYKGDAKMVVEAIACRRPRRGQEAAGRAVMRPYLTQGKEYKITAEMVQIQGIAAAKSTGGRVFQGIRLRGHHPHSRA